MFDLEKEIGAWLKQFSKHRAFDHGALREMELHLRDHIEDQIAQGNNEKEAFESAVQDFGQIPEMAEEAFSTIRRKAGIQSFLFSTLLNNYFKTAFRNMAKNPTSSFINVFGLAVAIGISVVVYAFFVFDYSLDQFHEHKNEVYLTTFFVDRDGQEEQYGLTPAPLGEMLRQDLPQIEKVCRIQDKRVVLKSGDKVFHEWVRTVDSEFLEVFTFPLKWGISSSLQDPNSIILSSKMGKKYFGDENPVGQSLMVKFSEDVGKTFTITGVAAAFPKAHIIAFDFLVNIENAQALDSDYLNDWGNIVNATLIQVQDTSDLQVVKSQMKKYRALQNEVEKNWSITSFDFVKLADLHFKSGEIRSDLSSDNNAEARIGLPIVAIIMLALACLNYLNIAIVSAAKRLKEIGLRKVIGANRSRIIFQFLCENLFLSFFTMIIGLILAKSLFIPWFSSLSGDPISLDLLDPHLFIFLVGVLLVTGIASGFYPALYISKFEVVKIFKGVVRFGTKNTLTKVFLTVQLVLTCAGITCAVIFAQNNTYQHNRSWGYEQGQALYTPVPDLSGYQKLRDVLSQNPKVMSIAGSSTHLGNDIELRVVKTPTHEYEVRGLSVDANYFETMGLELTEGRGFADNRTSDERSLIVNETFVSNLGFDEPIGEIVKMDSIRYQVVGVVKDFHVYNFYDQIRPTLFLLAEPENYTFLSMKVREGTQTESFAALQEVWKETFPETPFQGGHQANIWTGFFEQVNTAEEFYRVLAIIAVLLASLGLYGLVTLNVAGRIKEFSIRKALGADVSHLASTITKQYTVLLIISFLVGVPFSYFLAKASLEMLYAYPMPMTFSGLVFSVLILLVVLVVVFFTQVRKVSHFNPVDGLKVE